VNQRNGDENKKGEKEGSVPTEGSRDETLHLPSQTVQKGSQKRKYSNILESK